MAWSLSQAELGFSNLAKVIAVTWTLEGGRVRAGKNSLDMERDEMASLYLIIFHNKGSFWLLTVFEHWLPDFFFQFQV